MNEEYQKIFNQKALYLERTLVVFQKFYNSAKFAGFKKMIWLGNLSIFSLIVEYDLWIYTCSFGSSNRNFRNAYARLACVSIVESIEDILQMMGKDYQEFYTNIIEDSILKNRALSFRKKISNFRFENENTMREIRNYVLAHRDHNIEKQIEIINKMDMDLNCK